MKKVAAVIFVAMLLSPTDILKARAADPQIVVSKIHAEVVDDTLERVCIQFSDYFLPEVKALPGDNPRVFADIPNAAPWRGPVEIEVGGQFILKVRSHWHPDSRRMRVVLDLNPIRDYTVDQSFYVSGNIFCLKVTGVSP